MKTCPKCGELLGESVRECFNCFYDYKYGRVLTQEERRNQQQSSIVRQKQVAEQTEILLKEKEEQIKNNSLFEYKTVVINDISSGEADQRMLQQSLEQYSAAGWRLHSAFTNEVGKSTAAMSVGFLGTAINATIDQTILIFERCIRK